jgi:hypothetical protein
MLLWLIACQEPEVSAGFDFVGGDFQFYTVIARDECLGGALEAVFMPEGPDARHAYEYDIYVPSADELPMSYDVDFREPFVGMPVTVEDGGDGTFAIRGSVMESVVLDEVKYGDCAVTMAVDADLTPADADLVEGQARLEVSDPRGADELCPVFAADPCTVTLELEAERL